MRRVFLLILIVIGLMLSFQSCKKKDSVGPVIYLLGTDGEILPNDKQDTSVLMYTKYVDPGVIVEDNVSATENIEVTNNIAEVLKIDKLGRLSRTKDSAEIVYTATDEAGNSTTKSRYVSVVNPARFLEGRYRLAKRTTINTADEVQDHLGSLIDGPSITADSKVPGRIKFNKVYSHRDTEHFSGGKSIYLKVSIDLFDPVNYSRSDRSEKVGYLGTSSDKDIPFYVTENGDYTVEQATDSMYVYTGLCIGTDNEYNACSDTDSTDYKITISDLNDANGKPSSYIQYNNGNPPSVEKIVLKYTTTKGGQPDEVEEVFYCE